MLLLVRGGAPLAGETQVTGPGACARHSAYTVMSHLLSQLCTQASPHFTAVQSKAQRGKVKRASGSGEPQPLPIFYC